MCVVRVLAYMRRVCVCVVRLRLVRKRPQECACVQVNISANSVVYFLIF